MMLKTSPYQVVLPAFEGPLDLLYHLIREQRIDIYDIPIALITDQYMEYLSLMESFDLEIAGEFLVMAATLLEIKSKMLLPPEESALDEEEDGPDPRAELVDRLLEYERYKEAAETLRAWEDLRQKVFGRQGAEMDGADFEPYLSLVPLTPDSLTQALNKLLEEVGAGAEEVTTIHREKITLRMKMGEVWRRVLSAPAGIAFRELFSPYAARVEVIVAFLALLELLRLRKIAAYQPEPLGEITIRLAPAGDSPASKDSLD
ncbi:MAG: segregation/condensation protein A [Armatimonadetes bacterium]|nr:segregation/condensation protein A [Armatimonadota bacterium]